MDLDFWLAMLSLVLYVVLAVSFVVAECFATRMTWVTANKVNTVLLYSIVGCLGCGFLVTAVVIVNGVVS